MCQRRLRHLTSNMTKGCPQIPTTCNVKGKSWQAQVQDTRQRLHLAAAFWDEDCPVRQPSADQQHAFDLQQQWSDSQLAASQLVSCSKLKDPTVDLAKASTRPAKCRPRTAAGHGTGPTRKSALPVSEGPTCSDNKQKQSAGTTLRHSTACLSGTPRPIKMTPSSRSIFFCQTNNRESKTAKQAHLPATTKAPCSGISFWGPSWRGGLPSPSQSLALPTTASAHKPYCRRVAGRVPRNWNPLQPSCLLFARRPG